MTLMTLMTDGTLLPRRLLSLLILSIGIGSSSHVGLGLSWEGVVSRHDRSSRIAPVPRNYQSPPQALSPQVLSPHAKLTSTTTNTSTRRDFLQQLGLATVMTTTTAVLWPTEATAASTSIYASTTTSSTSIDTSIITAANNPPKTSTSTSTALPGTEPSSLTLPNLPSPIPQFRTVADVPDSYFKEHRYIYAYVERIIDGDTLRVRHLPGYGINPFRRTPQPLQQRGISQDTLSIRVYGVDTPELGKNKRQATQPFAQEAQEFTSKCVFHKVVKITFLRRDQYQRAVAVVETVPSLLRRVLPFGGPKDLSLELASAGLAELYTGGGAEYNGRRDDFERRIQRAQRRRLGIWSLEQRQSAADFKKNGAAVPVAQHNRGRSNNNQKSSTQGSSQWLDAAVTGLEMTA